MSSDSPRDEGRLDALLHEDRRFPPPPDFSREATISDPEIRARADADFETFWSERAKELDWFTPWDRVLDWQPPVARWFDGGRLNASWNCLDRHVAAGKGERTALIWEGEPGDSRTFTYAELLSEVARFAAVLRGLGVKRGDRVAIYLPMIPEAVIAILACARLGAPHSVVFGGFSPDSLSDRIRDAGAEVVITGDVGYRRGRLVPLKENTDRALLRTPGVRSVIVVARGGTASREAGITMTEGRDLWYHDLMAQTPTGVDAEPMEAEDVLFILYTSGTTGRPKGVVHTTGGYLTQVHATTRWVLDLQDRDVFFCTADIGWVTGHSYVVYGPLAAGGTVLIYEGAPDTPHRGRFWELCERWGVTILYTAPTAIRAFMKWGAEWVDRHDLSRLRLLGSVGEPINPEAWNWYREVVGGGRCPVVDTWWQTETGAIMIAPLPGITVTTPGSATRPFPGTSALVLDGKGDPAKAGYLAIPRPWPSMLRTIWGDDARYRETYWSKWGPAIYFPGDSAKEDAHGDLWILGRVDDVLNVAGHRIGTMEVESALVDHPAVAEAAVVGKSHDVKGQAIAAFVTLRDRSSPSSELMEELRAHVVEKIGAIARPDQVLFAADLPKTRSGKIMRRLLRDIAEGKMLGDTTTLSDPAVVARLKEEYENTED